MLGRLRDASPELAAQPAFHIVVGRAYATLKDWESAEKSYRNALELAPEDFDAEQARLTDLGFQLRTGQHPVLPSRTMYLDDPDGNEVELICRA